MLGKLVQSCRHNVYVDTENLLKYSLASVYLALGNSNGAVRKTCKSKLYNMSMYDLVTVDKANLPGHGYKHVLPRSKHNLRTVLQ